MKLKSKGLSYDDITFREYLYSSGEFAEYPLRLQVQRERRLSWKCINILYMSFVQLPLTF